MPPSPGAVQIQYSAELPVVASITCRSRCFRLRFCLIPCLSASALCLFCTGFCANYRFLLMVPQGIQQGGLPAGVHRSYPAPLMGHACPGPAGQRARPCRCRRRKLRLPGPRHAQTTCGMEPARVLEWNDGSAGIECNDPSVVGSRSGGGAGSSSWRAAGGFGPPLFLDEKAQPNRSCCAQGPS
jgi:hypothetical protein